LSERHLHIISFDIPYPPDYGGVVDIYNRIKALSQIGIKIHLHCFEYGRKQEKQLEQYCTSVNYYRRNTSPFKLLSSLPYIVGSRKNEQLINNILKDDYPVLMEGIHTSYYLKDKRLAGRKIILRSHNIEHDYYRHLSEIETRFLKRLYFRSESGKLRRYEYVIKNATKVAAISPDDTLYINRNYGNAFYLPAFHGNEKVSIKTGQGEYALYHGNLGVGENNFAALFLVNNIFNKTEIPLIIAGNNPSAELVHAIDKYPNITLKKNPDVEEMKQLIQNAQINILPTFQSTGIKLKLINALYNGRFCIVNSRMVEHTGLEQLCRVTDSEQEMINAVQNIFKKPFTEEMITERAQQLQTIFSNEENARRLIGYLF
jgi:Glycosyl transferases group 1